MTAAGAEQTTTTAMPGTCSAAFVARGKQIENIPGLHDPRSSGAHFGLPATGRPPKAVESIPVK
jgi:hypothetical protein